MNTTATFLGPVNELPAEGSNLELNQSSPVEMCAAMFSDSGIAFDVSRDGVLVQSNPQGSEVFQRFQIKLNEGSEPDLEWADTAFDIQLQGLFPDASAFKTLSDASEPEDYVRRFLEVLGSSLDDPSIKHDGAMVPLIRWQAGEDKESAQIQLLGILLADEAQFESFCETNKDQVGLIFEDAEIQAHGLRETVTVLALLAITLGSATNAEAGLFKKLKQKKQTAKMQQIAYQNYIQEAAAPVQQVQQETGWKDVHNDAYFNHALLEAGENAERKIIVDVGRQRAVLLINNQIAIDTAVSTARSGKETPRGIFKITQRVETGKTSSIYGCSLPYWQRLDQSAIGLHVGDLPGYAASAGCIRLPHSVAPILFAHTASGIEVEVVDSWDQEELHQGQQARSVLMAQVSGESNQQAN